jgi:hypothetical protein
MDILARRTRASIDYAISESGIDVLSPNNEIPLAIAWAGCEMYT